MAKTPKHKSTVSKRRVPPSKRQKPSQRNITVKDLRDINHHIADARQLMIDSFNSIQEQVNALSLRVGSLEEYTGIEDARAVPVPERTSALQEEGTDSASGIDG